jgi:hypothetical protein
MSKHVTMMTWDDIPHLSEEAKQEVLASYGAHEKDARSKGVPQLGAGAIYTVDESQFVIEPIQFPAWYVRAYGMDVGWNRTAVIWGALDRETDVLYLYSEHYMAQEKPIVHADAIRARGAWIPGVIDPAARGRSQDDGKKLYETYTDPEGCRLNLAPSSNAVEAGIYDIQTRLSTGRLKVFKTLTNWLMEYRIYRRDEKGKIVKDNDHALDATRYLILSGLARAIALPPDQWADALPQSNAKPRHQISWSPMDQMYDGTFAA